MNTSLLSPTVSLLCLLFGLGSAAAHAASTVLTGDFDGSEALAPSLFGYCPEQSLQYQVHQFKVEVSGDYQMNELRPYLDGSLWPYFHARVYARKFDPGAPDRRVAPYAYMGWFLGYQLTEGVTYLMVVQRYCDPGVDGHWAVALTGPGALRTDLAAELPAFSSGRLEASDPVMPSDCGELYADAWWGPGWGPVENAHYQEVGPIRVSRDGEYFYESPPMYNGARVCLLVYSAPPNPADRQANRVAMLGGWVQRVELKAGTDYYFVTQWDGGEIDDDVSNSLGEFLHVLLPPPEIGINPGLSGSWYDPGRPGEGYFLSVLDKLNQVFLADFTFDQSASPDDEFGHRWFTAYGPIAGASADLQIELSEGGAFNAPEPVPYQSPAGTMSLQFFDCESGQIIYGADTGNSDQEATARIVPIRRLTDDSVPYCESLLVWPGKPGPL